VESGGHNNDMHESRNPSPVPSFREEIIETIFEEVRPASIRIAPMSERELTTEEMERREEVTDDSLWAPSTTPSKKKTKKPKKDLGFFAEEF
jgi:hypothetical protein